MKLPERASGVIGIISMVIILSACAINGVYVKRSGGVVIRERPDANSPVLMNAPEMSRLELLDFNYTPAVCDGQKGNWQRVRYRGVTGFCFDKHTSFYREDVNAIFNRQIDSMIVSLEKSDSLSSVNRYIGLDKNDIPLSRNMLLSALKNGERDCSGLGRGSDIAYIYDRQQGLLLVFFYKINPGRWKLGQIKLIDRKR